MMRRVFGLRTSGMAVREPLLCRFKGDDRRGTLKGGGPPDDRDSIEDGRLFLKPLSVLLRCRPVLAGSKDAEDELVLVRECWLFAFLAISLSRIESLSWVSYGCRLSTGLWAICVRLSNDVVAGPGLEKLNSMLGSTPPDVETNEFDLELPSPALLVEKEGPGPGDDMPCMPWKLCGCI